MKKIKKKKFITWFYTRKYLVRHLVSECGSNQDELKTKSTKELRQALFVCRNPINK